MCVGGKNVAPVSFLLPQSFTPPGHSMLLRKPSSVITFMSKKRKKILNFAHPKTQMWKKMWHFLDVEALYWGLLPSCAYVYLQNQY